MPKETPVRTGRPTKPVGLDEKERRTLEVWAGDGTNLRRSLRARIVLACAAGTANKEVANRLGVTGTTVCDWRERFRVNRLNGLADYVRPGAPRTISDTQVKKVILNTLEKMPADAGRRSTRLIAKETGVSQSAVIRTWRAFGLKPESRGRISFSKHSFVVEEVIDVVGLYLNPPDRVLVFSADKDKDVEATSHRPVASERRTDNYSRLDVLSLLLDMDIATGRMKVSSTGRRYHRRGSGAKRLKRCVTARRHHHLEILELLQRIDEAVPVELKMHVVLDNDAMRLRPPRQDARSRNARVRKAKWQKVSKGGELAKLNRWMAANSRYYWHSTPTGAVWLELVERILGELSDRCARSGSTLAVKVLEKAMLHHRTHHQSDPQPFVWVAEQY